MAAFGTIVARLGTALLVLAALGVLLSMVVGTMDVVGTQLFLAPLHGATEGITELMVIIVFLSLPHVQRVGANIRVELAYSHFGPRTRAVLDTVAAVAALAFFGLLFWQGLEAATFSWRIRESTMSAVRIPIYPAKFAILLGAAISMLQLVVDIVESARAAVRPAPAP
jgi:TRAP-type mannitol/chloroaromatic compound transport system permease small subunit